MREGSYPVVQRSSVVVEAVACDRQGRNCVAQVRIQEAEGGKKADRRDCVEARTLVVAGVGRGGEGLDHRICVVAEAEELVRGSTAALDDSRGLGWVALSRSQVEAASGGMLPDCETLGREPAAGIRREVVGRLEFAMRDRHPTLPSKLRSGRLGVGEIALER